MTSVAVPVLDNLPGLRTPESLARLLRGVGKPVGRVVQMDAETMPPGFSHSVLTRLTLRIESPGASVCWRTNLVVKDIVPFRGWLGAASADARIREVQLWRSGLLARLPRGAATGVLAAAYEGAPDGPRAGALLLGDLRARLLRRPLEAPHPRSQWWPRLLDVLAQIHAAFWNAPGLWRSDVGLVPARAALLLAAPNTVAGRLAAGEQDKYLAGIPAGWEAFLAVAPPWAAESLRAVLAEPAPYVREIERLPATLTHGDVWGPNLGGLPATRLRSGARVGRRILLLDWALATAGPCTYDVLWLCGTWHTVDPQRTMAAYRARLRCHLARRGRGLDAADWGALADAGYLRTALVCGEAFGRAVLRAHAGAQRRLAERRAGWWAARAARAAKRLRGRAVSECPAAAPPQPY